MMRTWSGAFLLLVGVACAHGEQVRSTDAADVASGRDHERELLRHRAIQAVIWGMPAVNRDLMYQAMLRETEGRSNQMLYWSRPLDWRNQTLTPNTDVIYFLPHFDTKDVGPSCSTSPGSSATA